MKHSIHGEIKRIPLILDLFHVCYDNTLMDKQCNVISLEEFNKATRLNVEDVRVISAIAFQELNLPPIYWSKIKIENEEWNTYPENFVISYYEPIESLEYPNFYIIPYYSNYVVSKNGIMIKKSNGEQIIASRTNMGYYTYRLTDDFDKTQNVLRHRIIGLTFLTVPVEYEHLTINHKNGIKGFDEIDNLEWATYAENTQHARSIGLYEGIKIEAFDRVKEKYYLFHSLSSAARFFNTSHSIVNSRALTNGRRAYNGIQYRFYDKNNTEWSVPNVNKVIGEVCRTGNFEVTLKDGTVKTCDSQEGARLMGLTRTSLMRAIRENRFVSTINGAVIRKLNQSPIAE